MSIRPRIVSIADRARGRVADLGLRVRTVQVVAVSKVDDPSALLPTETASALTLAPAPRVRDVPLYVGGEAGKVQSGDLVVDRISALYTREQLDPGGDGHWLVDGQPYRVLSCEPRFTEWRVHLRRLTRNA